MIETELEYDVWIEAQIKLLKAGQLNELDIAGLIEELEALGRAEKSAVKSYAYQILIHLLLVHYWKEESLYNKNHWQAEINAFKFKLTNRLTTNLKKHLQEELESIYRKAKRDALLKSNLPQNRFPNSCPFKINDLIDD